VTPTTSTPVLSNWDVVRMTGALKAIKELRQGPTPAVAIGRAEQVNVAKQQVNAVVKD
jgi:hypothetical protein